MMYSAYELNKQGNNIQPWCTVRWSGHTVKGFSIINESEVDVFQEFPCFLYDPTNIGYLISGSSAFSKPSLYIWKFSVHVMLKSSLKDFEHYRASMRNEHSCAIVLTFCGIAFVWDWNENWPFPVLWPLLSFPNLGTYWVSNMSELSQHRFLGFEIAQLGFHHLH